MEEIENRESSRWRADGRSEDLARKRKKKLRVRRLTSSLMAPFKTFEKSKKIFLNFSGKLQAISARSK